MSSARAIRVVRDGLERLLRRLLLAAAVGLHAAVALAASPAIESIVVKLRDGVIVDASAGLPAVERAALDAALQVPYSHVGYKRNGALKLELMQPLPLDAARAAVNRLRLLPKVLYANIVPPASAAPDNRQLAQTTAARQPPVRRLIVKLRDPAASAAARRNEALGNAHVNRLSALAGQPVAHQRAMSGGAYVVRLFQAVSADQARLLAAALASDPAVEYAEPDLRMYPALVPNDPSYLSQWHYRSPPAAPGGANLPPAWDITTGVSSVFVAVIDTGSLPAHPDLAGRYVGGYDFIDDLPTSNDGDGRDGDPSDPGDWITAAESQSSAYLGCSVSSSSFHGAHVAGTIGAATGNSAGVAGINWVSKIVAARVLGKCGGYFSDIVDAIRWSAGVPVSGVPGNANAARVLNLSLSGGGSCDSSLQGAIDDAVAAGAVVVVAAGNDNSDAAGATPANCDGVITVGATGSEGQRASYSNYGPLVEISAPGGSDSSYVLSTINDSATAPALGNYTYGNLRGTSMATPHVAGIASLMLSVNPTLTPAAVSARIQTSARAFPTGTVRDCSTELCGAGIIDAGAAVAAALSVLPQAGILVKGVPVTGLAGSAGAELRYTIPVPAGATNLTFTMAGGTGDADLYVRFGAAPTTTVYDCRPYLNGNSEACSFATPQVGTYHVLVHAYSAIAGVSLTASYSGGAENVPPTANFTFTTSGLTASFTDTSTDSDGSIVARGWSFGDATISAANNPSKTYAAAGTYNVTLSVTDNAGATRAVSKAVAVSDAPNVPPTADFGFTTSGLTASFTDTSTDSDGTIASRSWSFGDGTSSTANNPSRTYAAAGTYDVTLTVTDNAGASASVTKQVTVSAPANLPPAANFSFTTSGLTASFTDTSTDSDGTIATRSWSFGDGATSTATNPTRTYATAGTYSVTLTVTDNAGASAGVTKSVTVTVTAPPANTLTNGVPVTGLAGSTAAELRYTMVVPAGATNLKFTLAGGSGDADLYVRFGSAPTTAAYDCRPYLSSSNETCTFATAQAGTYHVMVRGYSAFSGVSLTGSYSGGGPNVPPTANFSFATSGLTASFTNTSTDSDGTIASRSWSFGDGTTSTANNPSRTYAAAGTYDVTLTVTDNAGASASVTKQVTVSAPANVPPTANFTFTTSGLTATFTNTSTDSDGTIASRSWNFGDSTTSTANSPSKTYAAANTYSVTLTVTDNAGASASVTKAVTVTVPPANTLTRSVPVTGLAGSTGTELRYTMTVPAGVTNLTFTITGGSGDADLYVRFGSAPTTTSYDCRPYLSSSNETCTFATAQAGTYHVMVRGYNAFTGVSLTGSY